MHRVDGPVEKQAAVLHDSIEDTDATADDLIMSGVSPEAVEAVKLLTHTDAQTYSAYVVALKPNPIARTVKLADLNDNYALERVVLREDATEKDISRIQRYILSKQFLSDEISEAEYLRRMQPVDAGAQQ
jgi:(p)ppGpp synthase/HD superfamily hydrolase